MSGGKPPATRLQGQVVAGPGHRRTFEKGWHHRIRMHLPRRGRSRVLAFQKHHGLSLASESRVASQIAEATGAIFRQMFHEAALASTMDANMVGYVRLCQLFQAVKAAERQKKGGGGGRPVDVRVFLSGIRKRCTDPEVEELTLTGKFVEDLDLVRKSKKQFTAKAVDIDASLGLVLEAASRGVEAGNRGVAGMVRVANNSYVPTIALGAARDRAGLCFPYSTVDALGHIFDIFEELPELERALFVPGQIESCVTILRNLLTQPPCSASSAELFVRYVDTFLPRVASPEQSQVSHEGKPSDGPRESKD